MSLSHKELNAVLHDKKVRAELRKDPGGVLGDDLPFKDVEEYEVTTCTKEVTYIAIPYNSVPPLENIAAGLLSLQPKGLGSISTLCSTASSASTGGGKHGGHLH